MHTKLKIAVIGLKGLPAYGGAATVGENIIKQLKENYKFTVYSISSHTNLRTGSYNGIEHIVFKKLPIKKLNIFYYYLFSMGHCLFKNYDIVHLHHLATAILAPILRIKSKVVITAHGSAVKIRNLDFKFSKIEKRILLFSERFFLKYCNAITSVSYNLKQQIENNYGHTVMHIPNGINIDENLDYPYQNNENLLFAANRIIPTKGCHLLLKALKKLKLNNITLIIGDLEHHKKYKNLLLDYTKDINIEFIGLIKSKNYLFHYIRNSKLFIYPSFLEAMSMMLLEVASLRTPILCSNIPENQEIFNNDEVLFFNTGDENDLAEKISFALKNPNIMKIKSIKAFKKVQSKYNWFDIAKQYASIYNQIIN